MTDLCTDGRFELIEKYKKELIGITTAKNAVRRLIGRRKMGYTIRRWLSSDGFLIDDSRKAKTADEAISEAEKLAGIAKTLINNDVKQRIRDLEPCESLKIKRPSLGFSMIVRRNKK